MFCVIYQFMLTPEQEDEYQHCWDVVTDYFVKNRGALGSSLHRASDNLWIAYSRWPDKATRDASWPGDELIATSAPDEVKKAIETMQAFKKQNESFQQYDEIAMDLVIDKI